MELYLLNSHGYICQLRMYTTKLLQMQQSLLHSAAGFTQLGMLTAAPCVNDRVI